MDDAKSKWENAFDENKHFNQDGYERDADRYSALSPIPQTQISLEHSYSLPPERDPAVSPANPNQHSHKLFNHDHG